MDLPGIANLIFSLFDILDKMILVKCMTDYAIIFQATSLEMDAALVVL